MNPLETQEGGIHYKDMPIQPVEFIQKNRIPYIEGNIIKYVCRHKSKNGVEDLKKARHYIDLLIKLQYNKETLKERPTTDTSTTQFIIDQP
jgi:hypothetical protein